jgi:hypothetical protein
MTRPALLLVLLLAACGAEQPAARDEAAAGPTAVAPVVPANPSATTPAVATPPAVADAKIALDGEGLRLVAVPSGSTRLLAFGDAEAGVLATLERLRGTSKRGRNEECGAGPLDSAEWDDGLSVVFQDGKFVGWWVDEKGAGGIATISGIKPGATRAALEAAYSARIEETTIGTEFSAGSLFGLLDGKGPKARITDLWAGTSCIFR